MKKGIKVKVLSGIFATVLLSVPAMTSASDVDKNVKAFMQDRAEQACGDVLPIWISSRNGMKDHDVQNSIGECFNTNARLAVLGIRTNFPLASTSLFEVPAVLLRQNFGMKLDPYRPLAGKGFSATPESRQQ